MKIKIARLFFIASLVVSIILKIYLFGTNKGLWWDEAVYLGLGRNILKGKYYIDIIAPDKESFRCPFLPSMIALSFLINGENLVNTIIFIFSIAGIIATYYLGKTLYNKETGYLATALLSSFPLYIFFGQRILTESIFIVFSSLSLITFYLGIEKERKYLYLCGVLTGLSFLTKYFALILPIFYIFYLLLRRKTVIIYKKEFWVSLFLFLLTIFPRFMIDIQYYNSPIGGIVKNLEIYSHSLSQPFYFFITNIHEIFGFSIIIVPIGLYFLIKDRTNRANILILISIILPFLYFSFSHHKETRYLIAFSPVYAVCMGYTIEKLKRYEIILIPLLILFIAQGFFSGYQEIQDNLYAGLALKEGALFLKQLTSPDDYVMSESSPHLSYYAERIVVRPPEDQKEFYPYLENYKITYVLINVGESGNPKYLLNELKTENFEEIKIFYTDLETVKIYKKI